MAADEAIRLEHVSFRYAQQDECALADVSLTLHCGEMLVIMGATGAGKSTLAKCLNRAVPAFQAGTLTGTISILGHSLEDHSVADLAGIVGLVSQDFEAQLFATNVAQEVAFGMEQLGVQPPEMRARLPQVLHTVGLSGFERRDPATLSGGEKQRLAIAATLALQPRILVFDEPTTDLDPLGKLEIFSVLGTMRRQGYTLVVIEHESTAAEHADRLLIMSAGHIVADDLPRHVLADGSFLRRHGVRPPDLSDIAARMQLGSLPRDLDDAEAVIRTRVAAAGGSTAHAVIDSANREPQARAPLVQADAIEFDYETGAPALRGVSLTIGVGEFVALIGQNGSGKTTLAKHLNGLLRPRRGRVLLQGTDMRTLPLDRVAGDVGYVFQNPDHQIFAATVYDEVAFGPRNFGVKASEIDVRVGEALTAVGLLGYEDEDPFLLSKGHRQRLAVASLLALRPRLLILDEPTTGLDYSEQQRMMDLLGQLHANGLTVLMITHSPWVVATYAQRGVLMKDGRILRDAPLRELFSEEELLEGAHFRAPDVTRLGRRFGFTPLSVDELVAGIEGNAAAT